MRTAAGDQAKLQIKQSLTSADDERVNVGAATGGEGAAGRDADVDVLRYPPGPSRRRRRRQGCRRPRHTLEPPPNEGLSHYRCHHRSFRCE